MEREREIKESYDRGEREEKIFPEIGGGEMVGGPC